MTADRIDAVAQAIAHYDAIDFGERAGFTARDCRLVAADVVAALDAHALQVGQPFIRALDADALAVTPAVTPPTTPDPTVFGAYDGDSWPTSIGPTTDDAVTPPTTCATCGHPEYRHTFEAQRGCMVQTDVFTIDIEFCECSAYAAAPVTPPTDTTKADRGTPEWYEAMAREGAYGVGGRSAVLALAAALRSTQVLRDLDAADVREAIAQAIWEDPHFYGLSREQGFTVADLIRKGGKP